MPSTRALDPATSPVVVLPKAMTMTVAPIPAGALPNAASDRHTTDALRRLRGVLVATEHRLDRIAGGLPDAEPVSG